MQDEMKKETDTRGSDRVGALKAKVDTLAKLTQDLEAARSAAKRTRLGIVIGIILVFLIFGLTWYRIGKKFDTKLFVEQAQAAIMKPDAQTMDIAQAALRRVVPVLVREGEAQLRVIWPQVQELLKAESKKFAESIEANVQNHLQGTLDNMVKRQEGQLQEAFPALADVDTRAIVMANLNTALQKAVQKVLVDRITQVNDHIWSVYDQMVAFQKTQAKPGEDFDAALAKAWEQFQNVKLVAPEIPEGLK